MPLHPADRSTTEVYEEDRQRVIYADQLGFEEVFIGEHMSCATEPIPSPLMFLASLIHATKQIKLGTGVLSLPNHHPAVVAAEVAQFDHLSNGRFQMGIGPGGQASDMELFDVLDGKVRNEKMMESIDIILELWQTDGPFHIKTNHYDFGIEKTFIPELSSGKFIRPLQQPHPPILSTAMSPHSNSIKTAVERGWSPMSANFCPVGVVATHWDKYVEGCESIGREPTGEDWRVARNIVIAPTDAEAEDRALDPEGGNAFYFRYLFDVLRKGGLSAGMKDDPSTPDEDITDEILVNSLLIYGSPETVTEKLKALRETVGPFGGLLMAMADGRGINDQYERESMRLLAEQVMPHFAANEKVAVAS